MAEHESALAVLVDFENMARPGVKGRGDFDIHLVLDRLAEKGRVIVKRAYADWSRYRDARHELQNAGLGLIEMPSAREGAKNRADIQMAVDAMELAYSREHVDNFVIVSGDSDFTPLVGKLRELNKRVIGVGNRESASDLLVANCDEFIYYDSLAARATGGTSRRRGSGTGLNPVQLLQETLTALQREGIEWPLASVVKDSMRRKYPAFDETDHGFSTFSKFLEEAAGTEMIKVETDPRSGTYRVELGATTASPPIAAPAPVAAGPSERSSDESDGRRRRRRGGRRSEPSAQEIVEAVDVADVVEAVEGAEVFEVVVKERAPDPDLGALPPLDQPISYEDMIMLGPAPEVGEDNPDLAEASDLGADEPPSRSSRRRRRRAAVADPEPTIADLEPVDEIEPVVEIEAVDEIEPVVEIEAVEAPEAPVADDEEAGPRRRRRRRAPAPSAEVPEPAPSAEAFEPTVDVEGDAVAVPDPAAPSEAPVGTGGRRVRRRSAAATTDPGAPEPAVAVDAEPEAAAEAPTPRRRSTRKKAEPAAEATPAETADEAPKPRRRTRRAAPAEAEAPAADGDTPAEEAPKPRRRAPRKKTETAAEATPAETAADEAPKPRRRAPRKKAETAS